MLADGGAACDAARELRGEAPLGAGIGTFGERGSVESRFPFVLAAALLLSGVFGVSLERGCWGAPIALEATDMVSKSVAGE